MSGKIVVLIVVATFLAIALGEGVQIPPQPPHEDTTTTPKTTTTPTTTTPTTTIPTTTTPTTTTPTTTPSTTTPATTTTVPTTTSTAVPTTEPAPTTTTPKPFPKPDAGMWTVKNSTGNNTCIIAHMAIQLNVTYQKSDTTTGYAPIDVPANETIATGKCGNLTQSMTLSWMGKGVTGEHNMTLIFVKNSTTSHFKMSHIEVYLQANETEFPGIDNFTEMSLHNDKSEFSTTVGMSYHCSKVQTLDLTKEGENVTVAFLHVSQIQLEPFHMKDDNKFNAAEDCEPSNTPDIVPIAVGCALVGLVAIVLIAYLVGRRRSQARGYLSM